MLWFRVFVGVLAVVAASHVLEDDEDYEEYYYEVLPDPGKTELMDSLRAAAEAATSILDLDSKTHKDFELVERQIVSIIQSADMDESQYLKTLSLVKFIRQLIEDEIIQHDQIKIFIASFKSGELDEWLATWDLDVLRQLYGIRF